MNIKKISAFLLSFFILVTIGFALTSASNNTGGGGGGTNTGGGGEGTNNPRLEVNITNPFKGDGNLFSVLASIIDNVLLPIGGVLAVMGFIWAGFLYVTARGDKTQITTAHTAFKYTAIGTVILFGSRAIAEVIKNTIMQLR